MALKDDWLERKLKLLKAHLREVRESFLTEKSDREVLRGRYQQQKNLLLNSTDLIEAATVEALHAQALAELARHFMSIRKALSVRQRQEEVALQEQIDLEKGNGSKGI